MPHRHVIQHLLFSTRSGAVDGLDFVLIILGAILAALLLHVE